MIKVLVTGGTGYIGRAIAKRFLDSGCFVIIHGSSQSSIDESRNFFSQYQNNIDYFPFNCKEISDSYQMPDKFRQVDILVNAVGGGGAHLTWDKTTLEKWEFVYRLNVLMPVFFIKNILPYMKLKKQGRVINIASVSAVKTLEIGPEYSSAKAGVVCLTESLARECKSSGVTVNAISPGLVLTEVVKDFICDRYGLDKNSSDNEISQVASSEFFPNLVGSVPFPGEIAEAVYFLCSKNASKIMGQNIVIDSGYTLSDYVNSSVE